MDWQGRASQLVNLIDPERSFKAGEFEALDDKAWAALVTELRGRAATDARVEANSLRQQLAANDAVFAAEQRLRAKGASDEDIAILKRRA